MEFAHYKEVWFSTGKASRPFGSGHSSRMRENQLISKKRDQRVLGWLLILAGLGAWFYSPPGSDVVRAFLCLALISFGTAVLFAKSLREVEQVATRLLH